MKKFISTSIIEFLKENTNNQKHELPEYWYHGTNKYFERFDLNYMGKNWKQSELGVYFSQYIKPGLYDNKNL